MAKKIILFIIYISVVALAANPGVSDEQLEAIVSKADSVLAKEVVVAAKEADAVFVAARMQRELGRFEQAEKYYSEGLKLLPRNMEYQQEYAEFLVAKGDKDNAVKTAEIVYSMTERQELLERAAVVLGRKLPENVPLLPDSGIEKMAVCFVKIGPVDNWLVQELGKSINDTLGCPVYLYKDTFVTGDPDRSLIERMKDNIKNDINWEHPFVIKYMRDRSISGKEQVTGRQSFEILLEALKTDKNKETYENVLGVFKDMELKDKQWDANNFIKILCNRIPVHDNLIVVGITMCDIYSGDSNYLFGNAIDSPKCCVVSSCRFSERYYGKPDNKNMLVSRLHKQLLSSIGFTLSIPRSKDPRTARSYPSSLEEHDNKGSWLSEDCIKGFEAGLGYALPESTKEETRKMLNKAN